MFSDKRLIEDYLPIEAISADLPAATCPRTDAHRETHRGAGRGEPGGRYGR